MPATSRIRERLRATLGDDVTSWVHALRWAALHVRGLQNEPEVGLVECLLRRGDTAVDVGANGADWTRALSAAVGTEGHVHAFEAHPYYATVTRKAIALLGLRNVTLHAYGLGDRESEVNLSVGGADRPMLMGRSRVAPSESRGERTVRVRLRRLDDLLAEHPELRRTRLIKCDTEGYELFIFRGAERFLRDIRPVLIFEVGTSRPFGYSEADLAAYLGSLDFVGFALVDEGAEGPVIVDYRPGRPQAFASPNRIMVPREMCPRLEPFRT